MRRTSLLAAAAVAAGVLVVPATALASHTVDPCTGAWSGQASVVVEGNTLLSYDQPPYPRGTYAVANFYIDDRDFVNGSGFWIYEETNGEAGLQRGGAAWWDSTNVDPCQASATPDTIWL